MLAFIGIVLLLLSIYWYLSKPKNLPPGPTGIPLLGCLPWLIWNSKDVYQYLDGLKKYGNVVCIPFGFNYIIFLNDVDTIKEAFANQGDKFSGRGLKFLQFESSQNKGIVTTEGKYQRENRRFALKSLRNMGFGKMSFEEQILDSIDILHEQINQYISEKSNESFNFQSSLTEAVADNITSILFGFKFDRNQLTFTIKQLEIIKSIPVMLLFCNMFPFLIPFMKFQWFRQISGLNKYNELMRPLEGMIKKFIKSHQQSFDRNNINDFIDNYIEEQGKHQETKIDSFHWDDDQISLASTELLVAGIETTFSTISWCLFSMADNRDWQDLVVQEIDHVIGREKKPSIKDLQSLPLCEATILETLRYRNILDIGVPHATTEDAQLFGYFIPKKATIISYLRHVSKNSNLWVDPHNFNPTAHFLSADRKEVINRDKIIPFGLGRRSCIGESLARMELILFFITFFQKYNVSLDKKLGVPSKNFGFIRSPLHCVLKFQTRN